MINGQFLLQATIYQDTGVTFESLDTIELVKASTLKGGRTLQSKMR